MDFRQNVPGPVDGTGRSRTTLTGTLPPPIGTTVIGASAPPSLDLAALGVALYPGEALVVTAVTEASTAQIVLSLGIGEG